MQQDLESLYEDVDDRPLAGLRRADGTITEGQRPGRTRRRRNAVLASSMPLTGFRVLDIGCAEGLTSLYMAETAQEAVGLDHRSSVIDSARTNAEAVGASNVRFECLDVRDPEALLSLGSFDLVTAWGLLHRISDVFSLFEILAQLAPRVSLEWRTPIFPGMSRVSFAHHPKTPHLDPSNLRLQSSDRKLESSAAFWEPSVAAVASIGRSLGFDGCTVLGYGEDLHPARVQIFRSLGSQARTAVKKRTAPAFPTARVHAGLFQAGDDFFSRVHPDPTRVPAWDTLMARP